VNTLEVPGAKLVDDALAEVQAPATRSLDDGPDATARETAYDNAAEREAARMNTLLKEAGIGAQVTGADFHPVFKAIGDGKLDEAAAVVKAMKPGYAKDALAPLVDSARRIEAGRQGIITSNDGEVFITQYRHSVEEGKKFGNEFKPDTLGSMNGREALEAIIEGRAPSYVKQQAEFLLRRAPEGLLADVQVTLSRFNARGPNGQPVSTVGVYNPAFNRVLMRTDRSFPNADAQRALTPKQVIQGLSDPWEVEATVHELGHAITGPVFEAVENFRAGKFASTGMQQPDIPEEWFRLYDQITLMRAGTAEALKARYGANWGMDGSTVPPGIRYAMKNNHEFASQAMSSRDLREFLDTIPASPEMGGKYQSMASAVLAAARKLWLSIVGKRSPITDHSVLEEFTDWFDRFSAARGRVTFVDRNNARLPVAADYERMGAGLRPQSAAEWAADQKLADDVLMGDVLAPDTRASEAPQSAGAITSVRRARRFAEKVRENAIAFLEANPIDPERLKVATRFLGGGLSAGLRLASSANPIMKQVSAMLLETTTQVGGGRATAAVRKANLETVLYGNSLRMVDAAAHAWASKKGYGAKARLIDGQARRDFDRAVYQELLNRGRSGYDGNVVRQRDPEVGAAADEYAALYQRSLDAQRRAGVVGNENLPTNSIGYVPQRLDGAKIAAATPEQRMQMERQLAAGWMAEYGWGKKFARELAALYTSRARAKTYGVDEYGQKLVAKDGIAEVRELVAVVAGREGATQAEAVAALKSLSENTQRGGSNTRHRLQVDMNRSLPGGLQVLDFYVTDLNRLAQSHVGRVSGEVALTEFGVPGEVGMRQLMVAAQEDNITPPTLEEVKAFQQVQAEFFGYAPPHSKRNEVAQGLRLMTSAMRLGGVMFNQMAEVLNSLYALGLSGTLRNVAVLPSKYMEVRGALKGAGLPRDHLMHHIEQWGGEIGLDEYNMRFPLRASQSDINDYMDEPSLLTRMLKGANELQAKVSFMRGLVAAQHRAVSEQIVMKAARMIRDMKPGDTMPAALRDMGFTDELVSAYKANLDSVAIWDKHGRLTRFDVTAVRNTAATEAFVQAVHRGTKQIIQGTFIGERNAWVHNDYMSVLAQLRTFSLTAVEKQWGRVRMNEGYRYAGALLTAQAAMALPIYMARAYTQSLGLPEEEREKFWERRTRPDALVKNLMNYASMSGLLGDALDITLMFGGDAVGLEQGRGAAASKPDVAKVVPVAGAINDIAGTAKMTVDAVAGDTDKFRSDKVLRSLPFGSLWLLQPAINLTRDDDEN
jgi:hypothetical protein